MSYRQLRLALTAFLSASMMGPKAAASQLPPPIGWSIVTPERLVVQGRPFYTMVTASIPRGSHLYALTQPPGGPVAADIAVDSGSAFSLAGPIVARPPDRVLDPSFGFATETYSDSVTFTVPITAQLPGAQQLVLSIHYQSCTDRFCFPPRRVQLALRLSVTPGTMMGASGYSMLPVPPAAASKSDNAVTGRVARDAELGRLARSDRTSPSLWFAVVATILALALGAYLLVARRR